MYAAQYTGHTKLSRLMFIAERAAGQLQLDALRLAADEVKKTDNTTLYTQARVRGGRRAAHPLLPPVVALCARRVGRRAHPAALEDAPLTAARAARHGAGYRED